METNCDKQNRSTVSVSASHAFKGLTSKIFIGMGAGIAMGVVLNLIGNEGLVRTLLTNGVFGVVGQIFVNTLQLLVVPVVFVSLVCGTAKLGDVRELGRIGGKTIGLYLLTTAAAISPATAAVRCWGCSRASMT